MRMTQEGGWDHEDEAWGRRVIRELVPQIEEAQCTVSLVPDGPADVKFAVELGLSVMMDKPIILVVRPGVRVPSKLLALADEVLDGDISTPEDVEALERRLHEYLVRRDDEDEVAKHEPYCTDHGHRDGEYAICEQPDDEPDEGGPFRPRWPLLVSEDTKLDLLEHLAEMVHTPRPAGPEGAFARGFETGMAMIMLSLGINEAASPERRSLPVPADRGTLSQWLYHRFGRGSATWAELGDEDRSYWEHEAFAAGRAVMRGGFKADGRRENPMDPDSDGRL